MADILKDIPQSAHPDLLVGYNSADDAGVFRISEEMALVQTLDFFPPIVDDPYHFGQIAAANALSDVYAMGGVPLTALNIVGFPKGDLPAEVLTQLLQGGKDKIEEAGAVVVGGHSIKDKELKYGVSVTGLVHPKKIITNSGAKEGDILFLTKRLGTGIITTAIKRNHAGAELTKIVIDEMATLNRLASELMIKHQAHAATDITGYGLLGHSYEMAVGSGISIEIDSSAMPLLPRTLELAQRGMLTGGSKSNREYLEDSLSVADGLAPVLLEIALDPQTSGGLLISIAKDKADQFAKELEENHLPGKPIGRVIAKSDKAIYLI